jgi:hypothetical protein
MKKKIKNIPNHTDKDLLLVLKDGGQKSKTKNNA